MPRDFKVYLEDMLEAVRKIRSYTAGLSRETFASDPKTIDAVVHNLEVIGEAGKKLPEEIRSSHPEVEWRKISGLRDILIHAYFRIDVEIVWDIVENKLPAFEAQVRAILEE
jgi:uncharacterized protein with HEPN domain